MIKQVPNEILFPEVSRMINEGKTVTLTPRGQSMHPFIVGGKDSVTLVRADNPQVGDIILFTVNNRYVLHRLIRIEGDTYVFRGDGNWRGTEQCKKDGILAKVTLITKPNGREIIPGNGRWWHYLLPLRLFLLKFYRTFFL